MALFVFWLRGVFWLTIGSMDFLISDSQDVLCYLFDSPVCLSKVSLSHSSVYLFSLKLEPLCPRLFL